MFIPNMHYLRFTSSMQNLRIIIKLPCTTLGSKGVGARRSQGGLDLQGYYSHSLIRSSGTKSTLHYAHFLSGSAA